jgi:glycosyltransferase involved in cell wall biosynthesis
MGSYIKDAIPSIVCNASGLVLPRPDSKQAQGGFPTKLGEYLASGNPVCATTVGEIPLYLTDQETVYFAAPGDVNSFTQALSKMEENRALAEQVGLAGQEIARKNFNKKIQSNSLFDFLNSL